LIIFTGLSTGPGLLGASRIDEKGEIRRKEKLVRSRVGERGRARLCPTYLLFTNTLRQSNKGIASNLVYKRFTASKPVK